MKRLPPTPAAPIALPLGRTPRATPTRIAASRLRGATAPAQPPPACERKAGEARTSIVGKGVCPCGGRAGRVRSGCKGRNYADRPRVMKGRATGTGRCTLREAGTSSEPPLCSRSMLELRDNTGCPCYAYDGTHRIVLPGAVLRSGTGALRTGRSDRIRGW